jgi:hypothetical protein
MPMNNRILRPLARPLLLDAVPGAAAAYSLRQLSNAYTGPVVTVRRSSDDAEADFKASEIDDGTLTAFCGAGDGLVKTWFDQSGNGNDASQGTAAAQPKIVDSGSLVTEGGKASLDFDGTDDNLDANDLAAFFSGIDKPLSSASVIKNDVSSSDIAWSFGRSSSDAPLFLFRSSGGVADIVIRDDATATHSAIGGNVLSQAMLFSYSDMDNITLCVNGITVDTSSASIGQITLNRFAIGCQVRISKSNFFDGTISELIIYPSDQSANRERIEGDLAWYY